MKFIKIDIKEASVAFIKGEFGLRSGYDKYLRHIIISAILIAITLYLFLKTEEALKQIEDNKAIIEALRIDHSSSHSILVGFDRPSTISIKLEQLGSSVSIPKKPAIEIIK